MALAAMMVYALRRQERRRREAPGPAGMSEYRTDLPIDECMDRLRAHIEADAFQYTCERQPDGGYLLHLTLHQPTRQPLDTLYTLRMEQGRQTVVTLMFVREAFGYGEPVFRNGRTAESCNGASRKTAGKLGVYGALCRRQPLHRLDGEPVCPHGGPPHRQGQQMRAGQGL